MPLLHKGHSPCVGVVSYSQTGRRCFVLCCIISSPCVGVVSYCQTLSALHPFVASCMRSSFTRSNAPCARNAQPCKSQSMLNAFSQTSCSPARPVYTLPVPLPANRHALGSLGRLLRRKIAQKGIQQLSARHILCCWVARRRIGLHGRSPSFAGSSGAPQAT